MYILFVSYIVHGNLFYFILVFKIKLKYVQLKNMPNVYWHFVDIYTWPCSEEVPLLSSWFFLVKWGMQLKMYIW